MNNSTTAPEDQSPLGRRPAPHRRVGLVAVLAATAVIAAACGSSQSAPTTTKATTGSMASSAPAASVTLASTTVPNIGAVLTGPNGLTLYSFSTDTPTTSSCTAQCAVVWPPLVVPSRAKAALASHISGSLGTLQRSDGSTQVTFKGHPLYYYQGDMAPGQDKGQGLEGKWFVLKTSTSTSATTPRVTTNAGGGGGGVGF